MRGMALLVITRGFDELMRQLLRRCDVAAASDGCDRRKTTILSDLSLSTREGNTAQGLPAGT